MELRTFQTARLAGRAASRWATTSRPSSSPSSSTPFSPPICASVCHRHFATTRYRLQQAEAEAPAPAQEPAPTRAPAPKIVTTSYMAQLREQRRQQELQQQGFERTSIFASPSSTPTNVDPLARPWTKPNSTRSIRPAQASQSILDENMSDLGVSQYHAPDIKDFRSTREGMGYEKPVDVKYRLRPVVGRTVNLQTGVDVARAMALLNMKCAINKVRIDANHQRFHERPGLKRKRLHSQRWRVRFREGFKATCSRVRSLAKQGW